MNKRLILFIISMLCFTTLTGCGIDRRELVGDIIIGNGYTGIADYLIKYNPAANEFESVVPGFYYEVEYNEDKSKILCYKSLRYSEILNSEICEYDIKSNELVKLFLIGVNTG